MKLLETCFAYCSQFLASFTAKPLKLASISHITSLDLPPNGTLQLDDPIISSDLLLFSKQPFSLRHLSLCLPIILLHHCEDIQRLCPYLWSLTISTNCIPDFEILLISCEISTHLRIKFTTPICSDTLEDAIKTAKKFNHEFIEGTGQCSNLKCSFRFQIRKGIAYAWLPDKQA